MLKRAKWLLILLGALALVVGGGIMLAPTMVSKEGVLASLKTGMEQAGMVMEISTAPQISVGMNVTVGLDNVVLKPRETSQGWTAKVRRLELQLPLSALFSTSVPSAVRLGGVDARLIGTPTTGEPLPLQIVTGLAHLGRPGFDLSMDDGVLRQGTNDDAPALIENIASEWSAKGAGAQLRVTGQYHTQPLTLKAEVLGEEANRTIEYTLEIPGLTFGFQGTRSADATPLLQGTLDLSSDDTNKVRQFFSPPPVVENTAVAAGAAPVVSAPVAMVSNAAEPIIKFSGKLFYQGDRFVLKEMTAAAPGLKISGELGGTISAPYGVQANLNFPLLDTDALETAGGMSQGGWLPSLLSAALTTKASAKILLHADQVQGLVKGQQLVSLIEMQEGTAHIQQTRLTVAGDTTLGFEGAVTMTPQGPTLIGHASAEGKSFRAFLPAITPMPMTLPDKGFEDFALAGDLRLSAEDLRLSDFRAKIGRSTWSMAFIDQFDTHDVGLRVAAKDMDVDALLEMQAEGDGMRLVQKRGDGDVMQAHLLPPYLQEKLLNLRANYNLYLYLENYTFDNIVREPLELRARIVRGRVDLDQLTTKAAGADISIQGNVDVNSSIPKVALDMKLGDFDLGRIQKWLTPETVPSKETAANDNSATPESPQGTRWSNVPLNWHFVPLAEGPISLTAARILHPLATASNAVIKAHLANEQLIVDEATAKLFNADLRAKGQISTGALPAWQVAFTLGNLEIAELGRALPSLKDIQGRISFSGALATNGISELSQIRNMRGSLAMSGRSVQINQFDLSGTVDALRALKSVDNLKNEIDRKIELSNTKFDSLEGNIALDSGKIAIPRILMRSPRFVGITEGQGSLLDWNLEARTAFPLSVIRAQQPPELVLNAHGPLDALVTERDDRDLEKYVTDKTANELIQGR